VTAQLDGIPVCFLGRDELLQNKQAAGRAKDIDDLQKLAGRT
jgi:hypothetical protein